MSKTNLPEAWLRGPLEGVPGLVQPVAHAFIQAGDELEHMLKDFPENLLWVKPEGLASVGFHLQHLKGVIDRLFTYARGEGLSEEQLSYLKQEGIPTAAVDTSMLLQAFNTQVTTAIQQLKFTAEKSLTEKREVGRAKLPSTKIGLLVHAAEHTMRHTGQLFVTTHFLKTQRQQNQR